MWQNNLMISLHIFKSTSVNGLFNSEYFDTVCALALSSLWVWILPTACVISMCGDVYIYIQQSTKNYYSAFIVLKWVWEIWELHPKTQHPIVNPLWLSRSLSVFSAGEWRYSTVFIAVSVTIWIARYVLQWVTLLLHQETKNVLVNFYI